MAGRKKGFDPLSSLFEIPDPAAGVPLPPIEPPDELDGLHGGGRTFEMTDPFYQAPPGIEVTESVEPPGDFPSEPTQVSMVAPVIDAPAGRVSAFDPPSSPGFAPPDPFPAVPAAPVSPEDSAPSDPPAPEPEPEPEPEPVEPAGPSDEEKVRIARALVAAAAAKASAAKAGAAKKPDGESSPAARRAAKASTSQAPAPAAKPASRLDSLAARTRRPVSALEAARAAAAAEAARAEELAAAAPTAPVAVEPPADGAEPSEAEKARIAKALVASAAAKLKSRDRASSSASESGPSDSDKVRIAKAVAAAAAARAAADAEAAVELSEEIGEAEEETGSRLDTLANRARRPVSALEAARAAAAREDKAKVKKRRLEAEKRRAQARQREHKLTDQIQKRLPTWLPGSSDMYVANAMIIDQREVHKDLWRAHRGNFVAEGELERAVSAVAVLNALEHIGEGQLIAAHVVTDASDYLVWLDLERQGLVAAFADARAFFSAPSTE